MESLASDSGSVSDHDRDSRPMADESTDTRSHGSESNDDAIGIVQDMSDSQPRLEPKEPAASKVPSAKPETSATASANLDASLIIAARPRASLLGLPPEVRELIWIKLLNFGDDEYGEFRDLQLEAAQHFPTGEEWDNADGSVSPRNQVADANADEMNGSPAAQPRLDPGASSRISEPSQHDPTPDMDPSSAVDVSNSVNVDPSSYPALDDEVVALPSHMPLITPALFYLNRLLSRESLDVVFRTNLFSFSDPDTFLDFARLLRQRSERHLRIRRLHIIINFERPDIGGNYSDENDLESDWGWTWVFRAEEPYSGRAASSGDELPSPRYFTLGGCGLGPLRGLRYFFPDLRELMLEFGIWSWRSARSGLRYDSYADQRVDNRQRSISDEDAEQLRQLLQTTRASYFYGACLDEPVIDHDASVEDPALCQQRARHTQGLSPLSLAHFWHARSLRRITFPSYRQHFVHLVSRLERMVLGLERARVCGLYNPVLEEEIARLLTLDADVLPITIPTSYSSPPGASTSTAAASSSSEDPQASSSSGPQASSSVALIVATTSPGENVTGNASSSSSVTSQDETDSGANTTQLQDAFQNTAFEARLAWRPVHHETYCQIRAQWRLELRLFVEDRWRLKPVFIENILRSFDATAGEALPDMMGFARSDLVPSNSNSEGSDASEANDTTSEPPGLEADSGSGDSVSSQGPSMPPTPSSNSPITGEFPPSPGLANAPLPNDSGPSLSDIVATILATNPGAQEDPNDISSWANDNLGQFPAAEEPPPPPMPGWD